MYQDYLTSLFLKGVQRCHPSVALPKYLNILPPKGETYVIGAGKAAAEMAAVVSKQLAGNVSGAVITRYGHGCDVETGPIDVIYSSHPVPDSNGLSAGLKIMSLANQAKEDDRVICLISGGGSALLTCPAQGISFQDIQDITDCLVKSGAPITEINCVRRHLSRVKGGRLANYAAPAEVLTLAISDVVGDTPQDIASGPTVHSPFEPERVVEILKHAGYDVSEELIIAIMDNASEAAHPSQFKIIAKASDALGVVENNLTEDGWTVVNLGDDLIGDASVTASSHAQLIIPYFEKSGKYAFISGGELTVDVKNPNGSGGPNLEYLTALMLALPKGAQYEALSCDSDGIDGSRDNAGGYVNGNTLSRCEELRLDPAIMLSENNSYDLFSTLGQLVMTGPTGTNVNDIRITLVSENCGKRS